MVERVTAVAAPVDVRRVPAHLRARRGDIGGYLAMFGWSKMLPRCRCSLMVTESSDEFTCCEDRGLRPVEIPGERSNSPYGDTRCVFVRLNGTAILLQDMESLAMAAILGMDCPTL